MRLFFAIWPDAGAIDALVGLAVEMAERTGGRATPAEKLHLTMAFLGSVPDERVADASAAGRAVRARPFELSFDTCGWFRGAQVAWIGCSQPAPGLLEMEASLRERLRERGFALEDRPFTPHVTLARKVRKPVPRSPIPAIRWKATELALVVAGSGTGRYTTLERWRLGAKKSP